MGQVFLFLLDCFSQIFSLFRNIKIDTNLSYFDFLVFLSAIYILYDLLSAIRKEKAADEKWLENKDRAERLSQRNNQEEVNRR